MLPSGLSEAIADDEPLARFITSRSQFNAQMVKPAAFLPGPKDGMTSVFRHGAEPLDALLRIAKEHVLPEDKNLRGVALCTARQVREIGLMVDAKEPPARHANISGWPIEPNDPDLTKARQKALALELAQRATLVRVLSESDGA
jgi:hypothetical protein